MLGFKNAFGRFDQARDLGHHVPLRHGSWLVAEQDWAVAEGHTRGVKAMPERVL
jgi:hypothetical protein